MLPYLKNWVQDFYNKVLYPDTHLKDIPIPVRQAFYSLCRMEV